MVEIIIQQGKASAVYSHPEFVITGGEIVSLDADSSNTSMGDNIQAASGGPCSNLWNGRWIDRWTDRKEEEYSQ